MAEVYTHPIELSGVGAGTGPTVVKLEIGDEHEGWLVTGFEEQDTDYQTKEPKFYPSGDPIMKWVLYMWDGQSEPAQFPEGVTRLYVGKANMKEAIRHAMKVGGAAKLHGGSWLKVGRISNDGVKHQFTAKYTPHESSGFDEEAMRFLARKCKDSYQAWLDRQAEESRDGEPGF